MLAEAFVLFFGAFRINMRCCELAISGLSNVTLAFLLDNAPMQIHNHINVYTRVCICAHLLLAL